MNYNTTVNLTRGWAEILFRKGNLKYPSSSEHTHPQDYVSAGGKIPLAEMNSPLDVYEMYDLNPDALIDHPRKLAAFDIVNICYRRNKAVPMILLPSTYQNITAFTGGKSKILRRPTLPLCAVILYNNQFPTFYGSV